jgi:hypothetical protein
MVKKKHKDGAPVFEARNYPPASFSLSTDGKKGKQRERDRAFLFGKIASYGLLAWPGVKTLAKLCGFSRSKTFELIADLKTLGCLPNAIDSKGQTRHGERGTRVRKVVLAALPLPGSSRWLRVKDCPTSNGGVLLVQFVNRAEVQNSDIAEVQNRNDSEAEVQNSETRSPEYGAEVQTRLDTKEPSKELPERTNPNPKEPEGWMDSFSARLGSKPSKRESEQIKALMEQDGENFEKLAERWLLRPQGIDTLKKRWAMFLHEYSLCRQQFEQDQPAPELTEEQVEGARQTYVEMYGDLDLNYYEGKLKEAKDEYAANGHLFDEETQQEMRDKIAKYEAKVAANRKT